MVSLSLSEEDVKYLSSLLEKEGKRLELKPNNEALIKINSGLHEIMMSRLSSYICDIEERETGERYSLSFKEFQNYFGKFPAHWNEKEIVSHIAKWCKDHDYNVIFRII